MGDAIYGDFQRFHFRALTVVRRLLLLLCTQMHVRKICPYSFAFLIL